MEDVGNDEPVRNEIAARLSRLGRHFEVLAGLSVGFVRGSLRGASPKSQCSLSCSAMLDCMS